MSLIIWAVLAYLALRWALPAAWSLAWEAIDRRIAAEVDAALAECRPLATHDATGNVTEVAGGMQELIDANRVDVRDDGSWGVVR